MEQDIIVVATRRETFQFRNRFHPERRLVLQPAMAKQPRKRKSYSIAFKQQVLREIESSTHESVYDRYDFDERMVYRWKTNANVRNTRGVGVLRKRSPGAGRNSALGELEDILAEWVVTRRSEKFVVRRSDIRCEALHIARANGLEPATFLASERWLDGFMNRQAARDSVCEDRALSLRSRTRKLHGERSSTSNSSTNFL